MDHVLEEAIEKVTSLYFDGLISYVTLTHATGDIAAIMNVNHRDVQEMSDRLYEKWENE
jgi:hypothetical protein